MPACSFCNRQQLRYPLTPTGNTVWGDDGEVIGPELICRLCVDDDYRRLDLLKTPPPNPAVVPVIPVMHESQTNRREYDRARKQWCKQNGVCQLCKQRPAIPERSTCETCATKRTLYRTAKHARREREGHCLFCNTALPQGHDHLSCPTCLGRKNKSTQEVKPLG